MVPGPAGQLLRLFIDPLQPGAAVAELHRDLPAQKIPRQLAQFRHRLVMRPPFRRHSHLPHRPEFPQNRHPLAGRAAAQLQAVFQVVERQRQMGDEQQAVDFADRTALAQGVGDLGEELNHFSFRRVQPGRPGRILVHGIPHVTPGRCQILQLVQHNLKVILDIKISDCNFFPLLQRIIGGCSCGFQRGFGSIEGCS